MTGMTITRTFSAPVDLVYAAWTTPEHFAVWFGTETVAVDDVTIDARPGGSWTATMHLPDGTAKGTVYTLSGGAYGDPDVIKKNDPYEDIYVKTPKGWKFKQRAHVRDKARTTGVFTDGVYPMGDPRGVGKPDNRKRKAGK